MRLVRVLFTSLALLAAVALPGAPLCADARAQTLKIAVVDFQEALNQVKEGAAARKKLEGMFESKRKGIEGLETQIKAKKDEYDRQAVILSDAARKQKEQELMALQSQYQQIYMQSEGEMQQAYAVLMEDLITKMRAIAETIAKEKGYNLVLEVTEGGVVYSAPAFDITAELIKRYDAANPG
jgi:outer membrane protein